MRWLFLLVVGLAGIKPAYAQDEITAEAFTSEAIQAAIDEASPGDVVFLPAGEYAATRQIVVDKAVTLRGAARLQHVAEPEWDSQPLDNPPPYVDLGPKDWLPYDNKWKDMVVLANDPPTWDETPSTITYGTSRLDYDLFEVTADNVRFEHLKIEGGIDKTRDNMPTRQNGVFVENAGFVMDGCEMTRFPQALTADVDSARMKVRNSYFHKNWHRGSAYGVRATGGAHADVRYCEFTDQRHGVIGSSQDSRVVVVDNYFHNDSREQGAFSVDMHPYARTSATMIVRDNIFRNTTGIVFHSGTGEVTGNYFDEYVDDWNPIILIGPREKHKDVTEAHDLYVGGNVNKTGKEMISVRSREYGGVQKWGAYNLYHEGTLWSAEHDQHPAYRAHPRPLLGDVYVTAPGDSTPVREIAKDTWYDLHAMALDPQGADNIATVGLQLVRRDQYAYRPGNQGGTFRADGNYFIETDGEHVKVRQQAGSAAWTSSETAKLQYVSIIGEDGHFSFATDGSHRRHVVIRFKLLPEAEPGAWHLHGYVEDEEGHVPYGKRYEEQTGWRIEVGKDEVGR